MSEKDKQRLKEYQRNYHEAKKNDFFHLYFFSMYKMKKELAFNNGHSNYSLNKYYFQKDKNKPININEVDTKKIVLSNKIPHCEHGANKYYIASLSGGFKPLYITIKNIKLYTNDMNV